MSLPRLSRANNKEKIEIRFALRIIRRWYTQQVVLKVRNDTDDLTITFRCNKGEFEIPPWDTWEHPFVLGASAAATMKSIEITGAVKNGRQLTADEFIPVLTEKSICWWPRAGEKGTSYTAYGA